MVIIWVEHTITPFTQIIVNLANFAFNGAPNNTINAELLY